MIVIDEVAGYAAAVIALTPSFTAFAVAFLLDIVKIEPGKLLEKIGGGVGIVLDDIAAGLYACLCTHAFLWTWSALNLPVLP